MAQQKKDETPGRDPARASIEIDLHDEADAIEESAARKAEARARKQKEAPPKS